MSTFKPQLNSKPNKINACQNLDSVKTQTQNVYQILNYKRV